MSAPAQSYSILFSAFISTLGGSVPQGYAVTKSQDGNSYVVATTANLALSASGTIDGVQLNPIANPGDTVQVQRDAKVDKALLSLGPGAVENAVVDANGKVQRASVASGVPLGLVDKEGGVAINLAGAISSVSYTLAGDTSGPSGANTVGAWLNRALDTTAPTEGQVYAWHAATSKWLPTTIVTSIAYGNDIDASSTSGNQIVDAISGSTALTPAYFGSGASALVRASSLIWPETIDATPNNSGCVNIQISPRTTDAFASTLLIQAQNAYSGATVNKNGGSVLISGGSAAAGGSPGQVRIKTNDAATTLAVFQDSTIELATTFVTVDCLAGTGTRMVTADASGTLHTQAIPSGGTPGGSNTQMQYNNAGAFGGAAEFTYASSTLSVSASGAIAFGATPATSGAMRFANATTIATARNAGNTANLALLSTDASNNFTVGDGTNVAELALKAATDVRAYIGASAIATVSSTGFAVTGGISASTTVTAGSAFVFSGSTVEILTGTGVPASSPVNGTIYIRQDGTGASDGVYTRQAGAWFAVGGGGSSVTWATDLAGSTTTSQIVVALTGSSGVVTVRGTAALQFGTTNPAASGLLRASNAVLIAAARNVGNTADIQVLQTDASDNVILGDPTHPVSTIIRANAGIQLALAGTNIFNIDVLGSHHVFGLFSIATGLNMSVGTSSPTMNSGTNTIYLASGTEPSAQPPAGAGYVYMNSTISALVLRPPNGGVGIENTQASAGNAKASDSRIVVYVLLSGVWTQKYITLYPP